MTSTHFTDDNLFLEKIAHEFDTPYQIYDETKIRKNIRNLITTFQKHFKIFKQYFAVKALPNLNILKIMHDEGCGLDCSSYAELKYAEQLGITDIMFTSSYTSKNDLKYALQLNANINLDDISLIDDLIDVNGGKMPTKICFRLNPAIGTTDSETQSNILGGNESKFGIFENDIINAFIKAKNNGSTEFGLHMMTGSCVLDTDYWKQTVSKMMKVISKLKSNDIKLKYINIGGGIGIPYRPDQKPVDLDILAKTIKNIIGNEFELYMENGRYITGDCGWLVSRCNVIKHTPTKKIYGLDACMANLMRPAMYGSYHKITIPNSVKNTSELANVVGTLCENNDWFAKDRYLPEACKYDLFVIHDTGAHGHSMGFNYNSKLRAPEILINNQNNEIQTKLIRRRETYDDLISTVVNY